MDSLAHGSRPVRVLHVTEAAGGGVRRHLQRLVPELRRLGIGVDLLIGSGRAEVGLDADLASFRDLGCRTALFPSAGTLLTLLHGLPALRQALRRWQPEVLHLHATRAGLLGRLRGRSERLPAVVYSPHAFVFQAPLRGLLPWFARQVERRLVRATAAYVCVSADEQRVALAELAVEPARLHLVENGLERGFRERLLPREAVRAAWGIGPDTCLLGFGGRLVPQKDPATLLSALARCRERLPQLRLAVCGTGPLEAALRQQARSAGLEPAVQWLGFVPDLPRRLAGLDILALPSRYEGFPYILLEALAAGVPVLAADLPAHLPRPWLRGPVQLVPVGDPAGWATGLAAMVATLGVRRQEAALAAAAVVQEFAAERQALALAGLYAALAGQGLGVAPTGA